MAEETDILHAYTAELGDLATSISDPILHPNQLTHPGDPPAQPMTAKLPPAWPNDHTFLTALDTLGLSHFTTEKVRSKIKPCFIVVSLDHQAGAPTERLQEQVHLWVWDPEGTQKADGLFEEPWRAFTYDGAVNPDAYKGAPSSVSSEFLESLRSLKQAAESSREFGVCRILQGSFPSRVQSISSAVGQRTGTDNKSIGGSESQKKLSSISSADIFNGQRIPEGTLYFLPNAAFV